MTRAIDKATNHFSKEVVGDLRSIDVPEWGDENGPMTIYYYPRMNFEQQRKVGELFSKGDQAGGIIQSLIYRALDADKKPLFSQGEFKQLERSVDPDVVLNIVNRMSIGDNDYSPDEAEKN
jgi:hypothetical protein